MLVADIISFNQPLLNYLGCLKSLIGIKEQKTLPLLVFCYFAKDFSLNQIVY